MLTLRIGLAAALICIAPLIAAAQGANVPFGGLRQDSTLPVEVTADSVRVDQTAGTAVFKGNVIVGQGEMRLSADEVSVEYRGAGGRSDGIERLMAKGNVVLVNGTDAAEAQQAVYTLADSAIVMTGSVLLTQGPNAMSGERLVVNLDRGTGTMEGRVKTIFQPGAPQ